MSPLRTGTTDSETSASSTTNFPSNKSTNSTTTTPPMICLVLATDGVWDNWTYEDVTRFVMDASCVDAVSAGTWEPRPLITLYSVLLQV